MAKRNEMSVSRMLFGHRCYHGGAMHNFQPVHSEVEHQRITRASLPGFTDSEDINAMRRMTVMDQYVGHVCKWCGKRVKFDKAG